MISFIVCKVLFECVPSADHNQTFPGSLAYWMRLQLSQLRLGVT